MLYNHHKTMSIKPNFYEILQCKENATSEELKQKYKQLILQYHPDKMNDSSDSIPNSSSNNDNNNKDFSSFLWINTAWKTLNNPAKRKLYDAELCQYRFQLHNNVFDSLQLSDMNTEISVGDDGIKKIIRTYRCRCGGQYIFEDAAKLFNNSNDTDELLIECTECSLVIILK